MWSRSKAGETAKDIADHLLIPERIHELQTGQKELSDALVRLAAKVSGIEAQLIVLRAEVKLDAMRETMAMVQAVQGNLNQRIEDVTVAVALLEASVNGTATGMALKPRRKTVSATGTPPRLSSE